jgi:hypothetical protein
MSLELMRVVVGACSRSDAPRFRAMFGVKTANYHAAETLEVLELEDGEAEISGVEAAPAFHGQGLYGYAIQGLACLARDQRIWRINMKALEGRLALAQSVRSA